MANPEPVSYELKGDTIYRNTVAVAIMDLEGTLKACEGHERFLPAVKRWLGKRKAFKGLDSAGAVKVEQDPVTCTTSTAETVFIDPAAHHGVATSGFVQENNIPPMPEMDPLMGTKTPAVVAWYKKYHPEKWAGMHKGWAGKP